MADPRRALLEAGTEYSALIEFHDGSTILDAARHRTQAMGDYEAAKIRAQYPPQDNPGPGDVKRVIVVQRAVGAFEPTEAPTHTEVPGAPRQAPGGDAAAVCRCPLIDVSTDPQWPEYVRGNPAGCPVHGREWDARAKAAQNRARADGCRTCTGPSRETVGPTRAADLAELCVHVHAIQHTVLAQAAARAHPDLYRALGHTLPTTEGGTDGT